MPPRVCPDKQRGDDDPTNGEGHSTRFRRLHSTVERVEELLGGKTPCKSMTLLAYQHLNLGDQDELLPDFGAWTAHGHLHRTSQYVQLLSHLRGVISPWALHSPVAKLAAAFCLVERAVKARQTCT